MMNEPIQAPLLLLFPSHSRSQLTCCMSWVAIVDKASVVARTCRQLQLSIHACCAFPENVCCCCREIASMSCNNG